MINNVLSQISFFDKVSFLFIQLKASFGVMSMLSMELAILISVSLLDISFDFSRPLDEFLVFDLCEYLSDGGIKKG